MGHGFQSLGDKVVPVWIHAAQGSILGPRSLNVGPNWLNNNQQWRHWPKEVVAHLHRKDAFADGGKIWCGSNETDKATRTRETRFCKISETQTYCALAMVLVEKKFEAAISFPAEVFDKIILTCLSDKIILTCLSDKIVPTCLFCLTEFNPTHCFRCWKLCLPIFPWRSFFPRAGFCKRLLVGKKLQQNALVSQNRLDRFVTHS